MQRNYLINNLTQILSFRCNCSNNDNDIIVKIRLRYVNKFLLQMTCYQEYYL